jgi:DNA-directed RNA polymerase subunit RPC12/RpoP
MNIKDLFGWKKKQDDQPARERGLVCHSCGSDRIEMVLPVSPEVLSYRCTKCNRQWSSRPPIVRKPGI